MRTKQKKNKKTNTRTLDKLIFAILAISVDNNDFDHYELQVHNDDAHDDNDIGVNFFKIFFYILAASVTNAAKALEKKKRKNVLTV